MEDRNTDLAKATIFSAILKRSNTIREAIEDTKRVLQELNIK